MTQTDATDKDFSMDAVTSSIAAMVAAHGVPPAISFLVGLMEGLKIMHEITTEDESAPESE